MTARSGSDAHLNLKRPSGLGSRGPYNKDAAVAMLWRQYKENARKKGRSFNITQEELRFLTSAHCYYCGTEPYQKIRTKHGREYVYNGLDRRCNAEGYELDNTVACCGTCNWMKGELDEQDFIDRVRVIAARFKPAP